MNKIDLNNFSQVEKNTILAKLLIWNRQCQTNDVISFTTEKFKELALKFTDDNFIFADDKQRNIIALNLIAHYLNIHSIFDKLTKIK